MISIFLLALVSGCAHYHKMETRAALEEVEWALEGTPFTPKKARVVFQDEFLTANIPNRDQPLILVPVPEKEAQSGIQSPYGKYRGFILGNYAYCAQWDTDCWRHEYVHYLVKDLSKEELEEILAHLIVKHINTRSRHVYGKRN